jgi:hypothetical protein
MRILVIDDFFKKRDPAMLDMYTLIGEKHTLLFDYHTYLLNKDYDILWLGIYHYSMGIDIAQVLALNTKPVIIDQADNEETIARLDEYKWLKGVTVLSRYLPHEELSAKCQKLGFGLKLLPWYINPDRVPYRPQRNKTCDIAFICSLYGDRNITRRLIELICEKENLTNCLGEYWGREYLDLLAGCRISVVECGRRCVTQKYLEGALAGCYLVGNKPSRPENNLKIMRVDLLDKHELSVIARKDWMKEIDLVENRNYVLSTFANKDWFYNHLSQII